MARKLTYCSFANETKCLGVLILEGSLDPVEAAKIARAKNLTPEGRGQLIAMPCTETDSDVPPKLFEAMWENRDKLLTGYEARELFDARTVEELDAESDDLA